MNTTPITKKKRGRKKKKRRFKTGVHVARKSVDPVRYRSGWELAFCEYLDNDENVRSFQFEKLIIEYVSNQRSKRKRRYIPDFLVTWGDDSRTLVEIKASRFVDRPQNAKKWKAARAWCVENNVEFIVLTECELWQMGVLEL